MNDHFKLQIYINLKKEQKQHDLIFHMLRTANAHLTKINFRVTIFSSNRRQEKVRPTNDYHLGISNHFQICESHKIQGFFANAILGYFKCHKSYFPFVLSTKLTELKSA